MYKIHPKTKSGIVERDRFVSAMIPKEQNNRKFSVLLSRDEDEALEFSTRKKAKNFMRKHKKATSVFEIEFYEPKDKRKLSIESGLIW